MFELPSFSGPRIALSIAFAATITSGRASASVFDASGAPLPDDQAGSDRASWSVVPAGQRTGVGVLGAPLVGDICTAFAIDLGVADGPAYVVSNAHCNYFAHYGADFLGPTEHRVDRPTDFHVTFRHYVGVPARERVVVKLARIAYLTEHETDLAIFEADATVASLKDKGIAPLALATSEPTEGTRVALVGAPLVYVPEAKRSLHESECVLGPTVTLRNGSYAAPRSVAHQCSSIPGFSGGPLIDSTGRVALLNSHGANNPATAEACSYEESPCEVAADGTTRVRVDRSYGQHVAGLARCFDARGRFSLAAGCPLPGAEAVLPSGDAPAVPGPPPSAPRAGADIAPTAKGPPPADGCAAAPPNGARSLHSVVGLVILAGAVAARRRGRPTAAARSRRGARGTLT